MIPLLHLRWPGITGHSKGANDQGLGYQQVIQHQVTDGGQRYDSFSETHIQEQSRNRMRLDIFNAESLIVVGDKLQSPSPPITVWSLGGWMARFTVLDAVSVIEVFTRFLLICVLRIRYLCGIGFSLCTGVISLGFNRKLHKSIGQKDSPHTRERLAVELQNRAHLEVQGFGDGIPGQRIDVLREPD